MAELYVKPGNQEKGWNDPPQFSYGLQSQGSGNKRPPLTKRVPAPLEGSPQVPPPQSFVSPTPPKMPPASSTTPLAPPSAGQTYSRTVAVKQSPIVADGECNVSLLDVLGPLNQLLDSCREAVRKTVCDDISRRLTIFEQMWNSGKLSPSVKRRMNILARELQAQNWDAADEIHRSLMVDHVNEVSQWMVGIKRMIAEAKSLPSETSSLINEKGTGIGNPGDTL